MPFVRRALRVTAAVFAVFSFLSAVSILVLRFWYIPSVANTLIAESSIEIQYVDIFEPTEHWFRMRAGGVIHSPPIPYFSHDTVTLDAATVSFLYKGTLFACISLPSLTLTPPATSATIDGIVLINDTDTFVAFGTALLSSSSVLTTLSATLTSHVHGLTITDINLNKDVPVNGFDGLSNSSVSSFNLTHDVPGGGVAAFVTCNSWNPSGLSLSLGDVALDVFYQSEYLGHALAENVTVSRGLNTISAHGVALPSRTHIDLADDFFSTYMQGGVTELTVHGSSTFVSPISWLQALVRAFSATASVKGASNFPFVEKMQTLSLALNFSNPSLPTVSTSMKAIFRTPFDFTYKVLMFSIPTLQMLYEGQVISHVTVPWAPVETGPDNSVIMNATDVTLHYDHLQPFSDFVSKVLLTPSASISVQGFGSCNLSSNMGVLTVQGVPFSDQMNITGVNGFQGQSVLLGDIDVMDSGVNWLSLKMNISLFDPAVISLHFPYLSMDMWYQGVFIANATIHDFLVVPGWNSYWAEGSVFLSSNNTQQVRDFLSAYIKGLVSYVSLRGNAESAPVNVAKQALEHLRANVSVPGLKDPLIRFANMQFNLWKIVEGYIPCSLTLANPLHSEIDILYVNVSVYYTSTLIGYLAQGFYDNPVKVAPYGKTHTPYIDVDIADIEISLLESLIGDIYVDMYGEMQISVGEFVTFIDYAQVNIPASFRKNNTETG